MNLLKKSTDILYQTLSNEINNRDFFQSKRIKHVSNQSQYESRKNSSSNIIPKIKFQTNNSIQGIQKQSFNQTFNRDVNNLLQPLENNFNSTITNRNNITNRINKIDIRKRSEGFNTTRPYLSPPKNNQLMTDRALLSISLSPQDNKQNIFQNKAQLSPKQRLLFSPNASRLEENVNLHDKKITAKLVKQLRDAIKRTKYNSLEDQLNLEEQKNLENKIKNDILPQMMKIQELNNGERNKEISFAPTQNRIGINKYSSRIINQNFEHKLSRQISGVSVENSPAFCSKKNLPTQDEISIELLMIIKLLQNRTEYLQTLKYMNKEKSIDIMVDLLKLATELDDIEIFIDVLDMMAQTVIMFSDYKLALIILNMIKITCDMNHNTQKKIMLYRNYSYVCKKLGLFEDALRFLKKALQYIWLEDDKDQEIQIYDDLGLVFFHMVQLDQAKKFHTKSVQSFNEPIDNILREMSSRNIQKFTQSFYPQVKSVEQALLHKLLQFPFKIEKRDSYDGPMELHIENTYLKKNNLRLVKKIQSMNSQLSEIYMIQQVLQSPEFQDEISTPLSKPQEFSPLDFVRMKKVNDHFICIEEKDLKKGKSQPKFVLPKKIVRRTENTTFYLDDDKKKMDLDEKIKFRIKQLDQDLKKQSKLQTASAEAIIVRKENLEAINIGHLTSNRNVEAFTQSVSINYGVSNKFYDKMISQQFNKHNNIIQNTGLIQPNISKPNLSRERNS